MDGEGRWKERGEYPIVLHIIMLYDIVYIYSVHCAIIYSVHHITM